METLFQQEYASVIATEARKTRTTLMDGKPITKTEGINIQLLRSKFGTELLNNNKYLGRYLLDTTKGIKDPNPRTHIVKLQCLTGRPITDSTVARLELYSPMGNISAVHPGLQALKGRLK